MTTLHCTRILAHNVHTLRKSLGLTQEEFAAKCKISYRLYQKLEVGRANPTLSSLDRIARANRVTVDDLLRLNSVRAAGTEEGFLASIAARFRDSRLAVAVRNYEVALWVNKRAGELHHLPSEEMTNVRISPFLTETGRNIHRFQLDCEQRGIVQPYIVDSYSEKGEKALLRYYPTNVYPARGGSPLFGIVYMTECREDTQKNYYMFCEQLLGCV